MAPKPSSTPESVYIVATNVIPTPTPVKAKIKTRVLTTLVDRTYVEDYIREVFGDQANRAIAVAKCESGLDPSRVNDTPRTGDYSVGVFQINLFGNLAKNRPSEAWLKDYKNNIDYAHKMLQASNGRWYPTWTCAK